MRIMMVFLIVDFDNLDPLLIGVFLKMRGSMATKKYVKDWEQQVILFLVVFGIICNADNCKIHSGYLPFLAPQERFGFSCVSFFQWRIFSGMTAPYSGGHYDFEPQRLRELHSKNQQRCHDAMEWLDSKKYRFCSDETSWPQSWMP